MQIWVTVETHCVHKKVSPPKHFAITSGNLHWFKYNFTHVKQHSFWTPHFCFTEIYLVFAEYQILNNTAEYRKVLNVATASRNSPTVYIRCSKCPPFTQIHLHSRSCHWFTALSIMLWSKRRHSSINHSFRWLASANISKSCWKCRSVKSLWKKNEHLLNKTTDSYKILHWWLK